jgi:hypothetical protein
MSSRRVFMCFLVKGVQDVNRFIELGDINHPPLAQHKDTNLIHAGAIGMAPRCTASNSNPASHLASAGKFLRSSKLEPVKRSFFMKLIILK